MIKSILENCIAQVENYRQQQITSVKQKVMQEKVIPHNKEIDLACREAVDELNRKHNERVAQLQAVFEQEKSALFQAAEENKKKFTEAAIAEAVAMVEYAAQTTIDKVGKIVAEQGE